MAHASTMVAGLPAEVRTIDVRTFVDRDECKAAAREGLSARSETLELWCVADLESRVDRDALLRAGSTVEPPYWALPWIGARAIAAEVLANGGALDGARVLDLGCGLGLSGVAAARRGAQVTFADYVDEALAFAAANAQLHSAPCETVRADFTRDRLGRKFDAILAADVVYDPAAYEPLVAFLDAHLAGGGVLLLTETLRADARIVLERLAQARIEGPRRALWLLEDDRPERTWLHELRRR